MNRSQKSRQTRTPGQSGAELENQFILRLLPVGSKSEGPGKDHLRAQAAILREAMRQGQTNIKDRLSIQLDYTTDKDDMRNGIITFDTIMYKCRLVDLPTILETWKTTDRKNFYKTADVCQMLMVREEDDPPDDPDDTKKKRRDPNKVDKKYLWPHGYTPPLKNVRKRRFRKTLRKKVDNLDLPEIEKEVKRLLRTDSEATNVRWEVVREEDEKKNNADTNLSSSNLDEHLFGEVLSSSEDEVGATINIIDEDDDSRLSVDDSHYSESFMNENDESSPNKGSSSTPLVTEFSPGMFRSEGELYTKPQTPTPSSRPQGVSRDKLYSRLSTLESDRQILLSQRAAQESEIANIENLALKQRFLSKLADIETQIREKDWEMEEIQSELHD